MLCASREIERMVLAFEERASSLKGGRYSIFVVAAGRGKAEERQHNGKGPKGKGPNGKGPS